ncbi:hypothetical protein ACP8Y2_15635 [Herpetosiphon llansteffanensis]
MVSPAVVSDLYPLSVGDQTLLIRQTALVGVDYVANSGQPIRRVIHHGNPIDVIDLNQWLQQPIGAHANRLALFVAGQASVAVVVDQLGDPIRAALTVQPLPSLVSDSLLDPSILGIIMLDERPCLMLDLELFVLVHAKR